MNMIRLVNSRIQATANYNMKQNEKTILCLYSAHVLVQTRTNFSLNLGKFDSLYVLTVVTFSTCNNCVPQENKKQNIGIYI